jgi:long-chain acyl-CoA synthetase
MSDLNLFRAFKDATIKFPDKTALIYGSHHISYKRLLDAVERLANSLSKLGICDGDRMGIMLPNIPQFVISYFALLKLGVWIIPINTMFKEEEIRYLLEDSEAKGIIAVDQYATQVQKAVQTLEFCHVVIFLGDNIPNWARSLTTLIASSDPMLEDIEIEANNTAVVLYTAGTTGRPKGAVLSHRNILTQVESIRHALVLESNDILLCVLPLFHSFGQMAAMNTSLVVGSTTVVLSKFVPQEVIKSLAEDSISIFLGLPIMFHALSQLDVDKNDFPQLKFCISSGGPLTDRLRSNFEAKFGKPILQGYGLTEAGPLLAVQRLEHPRKPNSVGFPTYGMQVRIVDDSNNEVQLNDVGEVVVHGQNVTQGYLNRPETSKEVLKDGWFKTGDLGKFDEDGYLYIVDRKKNVILKGGFNVYPREVESILSAHPKVKQCSVVGVKDEIQNEEVKALVLLKQGETLTKDELLNYCRERLAVYKCPKYIEFVKALPQSSTYKILKSEIN